MLRERDPRKLIPPLHGALLKNEQDVHLFERLAFLSRRGETGPLREHTPRLHHAQGPRFSCEAQVIALRVFLVSFTPGGPRATGNRP
jgi:hypothetical protein